MTETMVQDINMIGLLWLGCIFVPILLGLVMAVLQQRGYYNDPL